MSLAILLYTKGFHWKLQAGFLLVWNVFLPGLHKWTMYFFANPRTSWQSSSSKTRLSRGSWLGCRWTEDGLWGSISMSHGPIEEMSSWAELYGTDGFQDLCAWLVAGESLHSQAARLYATHPTLKWWIFERDKWVTTSKTGWFTGLSSRAGYS